MYIDSVDAPVYDHLYKIQCCFFFVKSLENHLYTHKIFYNFSYAVQCNIQEESGETSQGHLTGSCESCTGGGRRGKIGVVVGQVRDHSNHFISLSNSHKLNKIFLNAFLCQVNTCQLTCYHFYHNYIFVIMRISQEKWNSLFYIDHMNV